MSAVIVGEIQAGIETTREHDLPKAEEVEAWLDQVVASYDILPMEAAALREWARLKHRKSDTLIEDVMIAATAIVHRLTVVNPNTRNFQGLDRQLWIRSDPRSVRIGLVA